MVEVRLTAAKLRELAHDVHIANWVMIKLKEAGVPVEGGLFPHVTTGTLFITCDEFDTGDRVYRWRE
jgi:hypothetical protein